MAYVHLTKLFLQQENLSDQYHLVNMSSVAGMQGATSIRNSDYSASKAALSSFVDSLRQELIDEESPVKMTNIYPYIINTDLFKGFSGLALWLIPMLKKDEVAIRIYDAIMTGEQEVYVPWYQYWMMVIMLIIPSNKLRYFVIKILMGNGMKTVKKEEIKQKIN